MDKKNCFEEVFKLWIERKGDVAKLFSEALETTPKGALRIRKVGLLVLKMYLFVEAHLTKINT